MKRINRKIWSIIFLLSGMLFLAIAFITDNTVFSWAAIAFILISLMLGGRWMRPRIK